MASPSYTYTLTNGTTADATQVMQNFNDILNGVTDGTKDLSISALTVAGTATLNGNVNIGNASADDLTITASLASTIPIKTTNAFDIGSSTLGLRRLYIGNSGGSTTVALASAASIASSRTYNLPDVAGTGIVQVFLGQTSISSANYTILDNDGYHTILVSTGASQRTITLPAVVNNNGRRIVIKKTDSGAGTVLIDTPSTETIDGAAQNILTAQYSYVEIISDGSNWSVLKTADFITATFSSASASGVTAGQYGNLTSASIPAGRWAIRAIVQNERVGSQTYFSAALSQNTGNTTTDHVFGQNQLTLDIQWDHRDIGCLSIVGWVQLLTAATTIFLKGLQDGGTWTQANWDGSILAERLT